ncbi:MAG: ribonuclease Z [bacterium]|nr:ribonuclease Z [bacterium]
MSLSYNVLGQPGRDNSLFVKLDTGQEMTTMLFDCGDSCLNTISLKELQNIEHVFFSHFHMDHVAGFDTFFRCNYNRTNKQNHIWGPVETADIIQHRFQGYMWNLNEGVHATWYVHEYDGKTVRTFRFELHESFRHCHFEGEREGDEFLIAAKNYTVQAVVMDHKTPCLAYVVREREKQNIDPVKMREKGLIPGPWIKTLKETGCGEQKEISINNTLYSVDELKKELLISTKGESLAYLTDFLLDHGIIERLSKKLIPIDTIVCEGQYRHADADLAKRHYHMTTTLSAELAKKSQAQQMVLFHLSDRYEEEEWKEMLAEAVKIFPNTLFPEHWELPE